MVRRFGFVGSGSWVRKLERIECSEVRRFGGSEARGLSGSEVRRFKKESDVWRLRGSEVRRLRFGGSKFRK